MSVDEQCCRESAERAAALEELALAHERHCCESAERTVVLAELASANEQCCQESAERAAVLVERTLADELCCQEAAGRGATLAEMALAKKKHYSLSAEQAVALAVLVLPATALADDSNTAVLTRDTTASAAPALAKDKWHQEDKRCQEEAAAKQRRADNKCVMALDMPPDPIDMAIWRIQAECALHAAPLDTILAKIARDDITRDAPALPTTTLPHPSAMLSTPPCPMTYVGVVLSTMGGRPCVKSLALPLLPQPSPTVDCQT